ncbi:MAG: exopolyphosphatase [Lachnospiraceae bacterium]|nr:exopolyphosphatase [Lachnospiraceae bacterium]
MRYTTFAAIDVGSHEVSMKIFEISKKNGIKLLDYVHHTTLLGLETYSTGRIGYPSLDKLCNILNQFKEKFKEYGVEDYSIAGTSAIREASNNIIFIDQVKKRTGFTIKILSNSEQRFLCYKSIALTENEFHKLIKKGTLLVDVSGGSMQLSLFDKSRLITTQNIKLGSLRIQEALNSMESRTDNYKNLVHEYIFNDIHSFSKHYLKNYDIKNIIAVGNQLSSFIKYLSTHNFGNVMPNDARISKKESITKKEYKEFYETISATSTRKLMYELDTSYEQASLLLPTSMIYQTIFSETQADNMWLSDITLSDGMAAEYAEDKLGFIPAHSFNDDILTTARNLADRYECNNHHSANVEENSLKIFDFLSRDNSFHSKDRLLLQISEILHNCGSYINMNEIGENSYKIVMSSEIIGLSHKERMIVAYVVRYNNSTFPGYTETESFLSKNDYIRIAKLSAILNLADSMDKSHKQKFKDINIEIRDGKLYIIGDTLEDITLEQGFFNMRASFFEEVYGMKPELRQKKTYKINEEND